MENSPAKLANITVEGREFVYIKNRLIGGKVFVNEDKTLYMRTASVAEIAGEVNITEELYRRGFPVPKVVSNGKLDNGDAYYIEEAIGDEVLGDLFRKETSETEHVSDKSFEMLLDVIKKYCLAQFNPDNYVPHNKEELANMCALANVLRNNPPSKEMERAFFEAYEKAAQRTLEIPWVYIQSDLNVFNILPKGVIDFELVGIGPVGYDVFTCIYFGKMWPKKDVAYRFTDEQAQRYVDEVDAVAQTYGLPPVSSFADDFLVLKNIWGSGKDKQSEEAPESNPEFWRWRVKVRDWCIQQYLKNEKIDTNLFEEIGSAF